MNGLFMRNRLSSWVIVGLLVLATPLCAQSPKQAVGNGVRPDLYMLSVGIDRYQAPTKNLSGCVNDAVGLAKLFEGQRGKQYGKVEVQVLTDAAATRAKIADGLEALRTKGKRGDWYAILLSGHGGPKLHRWEFLTHDRGDISDVLLLDLADDLANQGKTVLLVVDACFVGQLRAAANPILNRHIDPKGGGIILAISSMPTQTSAALTAYSAFARAFEEGLAGMADYDHNQAVTLKEIKRFTYNRVYELHLLKRAWPGLAVEAQDSAIDASLSIPETTAIVQAPKSPVRKVEEDGPVQALPQIVGIWASVPPSGKVGPKDRVFRLRLDARGTFRATLTEGNRVIQQGDGIFQTTAKTLQLRHKQGTDRLAIRSVNDDELRFTFQGRELALRREVPPKNSVAQTTWIGTETLTGFGVLTFQFESDGQAIMTDAKSTVQGSWVQFGDDVTITFQNCVYHAHINGAVMGGEAHYVSGGQGSWTFSLTRKDAFPDRR